MINCAIGENMRLSNLLRADHCPFFPSVEAQPWRRGGSPPRHRPAVLSQGRRVRHPTRAGKGRKKIELLSRSSPRIAAG